MRRFDPAVPLAGIPALLLILSLCLSWPVFFPVLILAAALAGMTALALLRSRRLQGTGQALQERELQLTQAQQAIAKKEQQEQELLSRVERFRSVLSHDLRMPISIIQGYAELLDQEMVTDPETQKEYIKKILKRTQDMSEALSLQLTNARHEELAPPACVPMELLELTRQAASDMSNTASGRGISIQVISPETALWVNADHHQVGKIFFNLVENSIKYMGREGLITIRLLRKGAFAQVTVKDDGLGLDPEATQHIFELYYQGPNRIPGQGHGHGLHLVKRAVEAQGGSITASSNPGLGMTITFTLPLAEQTLS